jgi:GNAT superfamily N-acetyltransferase
LRAAGLTPVGDRPLAIHRLSSPVLADQDVIPAGEDFADLLVAGYEVDGVIAEFIRAEHRSPAVHRFQLLDGSGPIAAAAMTIHGEVAVLGGASTLPAYRGRGAQSRLLRHRLSVAATEGCVLAVATASAGSVSAANLRKAGFELHHRQAWTMTNDADTAEL